MKTAIKQSPNMKRLDNIERMLKTVSRDANKVLGERETLANERDKWKARAESAERQLDAVRAALNLKPPTNR